MPSIIIVGAQWGDEGKGKIIDILTASAKHVVRAQGGNNAGHTISIGDEEYKLHLTPSGILHPHTQCYLGAGTVIDPKVLIREIEALQERGIIVKNRLWISPAAHVIFPYHRVIDRLIEKVKGNRSVGTTGRGIGPCYSDKANRIGIRIDEMTAIETFPEILKDVLEIKNRELKALYLEDTIDYKELLKEYQIYADFIRPLVTNVEDKIDRAITSGASVLFEGAQGTFLDITSGTYPFVTSSNTTASGICVGAGIGPSRIDHTIGIVKAYTTRVGNGPLPTEVGENEQFLDHKKAREFGTTTKRMRRIGWFDSVLVKTAVRLNGLNSMALTKLDVLDNVEEVKICVAYDVKGKRQYTLPSMANDLAFITPVYETMPGWLCDTSQITRYEELPYAAKEYLNRIETLAGIPISILSLGPNRKQTITLLDIFSFEEAVQ